MYAGAGPQRKVLAGAGVTATGAARRLRARCAATERPEYTDKLTGKKLMTKPKPSAAAASSTPSAPLPGSLRCPALATH